MNKKYYKYVFTFLVLLSSSFLCLNRIKALETSDFCNASNKLYCEYTISGVKVVYTIENGKLSSKVNSSIGANLTSNLTMENFKSSAENKYKCFDKLYFTSSMSGRTINIRINADEQNKYDATGQGNFTALIKQCNTFIAGHTDSKYACGIYGGMQLYSLKQNDKFIYSGTYTDKINGNAFSFETSNVGTVKGSIDSNGCPEELCYSCNMTHKICNSASGNSNCYKKGSQIQNQDDIVVNQDEQKPNFFDDWSNIPAVLGGISEIVNGEISCEGETGVLGKAWNVLQTIFTLIKIIGIALLIVLSMLDFMKAVTADETAMKKATKNAIVRLIIVVVLFMLPALINLILKITYISSGTCGIK